MKSRYPGGKGRWRVAAVAPAADNEPDFEPLLSTKSINVARGFGSSSSPRPSNSDRLRPMQMSHTDVTYKRSSAEELLQCDEESSPLLGSTAPNTSLHTPKTRVLEPAVAKAQHHLTRGRHHYRSVVHSNHHHHPTRTINQHGAVVVRGRNNNPAPDSSIPLCSNGCCCFQCIRTNEMGIVEHFGRFQNVVGPGQICMPWWPCTRVAARVSLRVQQMDVTLETKSLDNVFLNLHVVVLFRVRNVHDAHYTLTNARPQIKAYVLDVVRSTVPQLNVDKVFAQTSDIALSVLRRLQGHMSLYGYEIMDALVTRISPNAFIKASMNEINASKRIKYAMSHKAEANKIKKLKDAQAASERSYLEGVGVANQRKAIASGMKQCLEGTKGEFPPKDVMDILLLSHYMDTLVAIGANSMMLHQNPGELAELQDQLSLYFVPAAEEKSRATPQVPDIPDLLW